jgi:hypothetical protein
VADCGRKPNIPEEMHAGELVFSTRWRLINLFEDSCQMAQIETRAVMRVLYISSSSFISFSSLSRMEADKNILSERWLTTDVERERDGEMAGWAWLLL